MRSGVCPIAPRPAQRFLHCGARARSGGRNFAKWGRGAPAWLKTLWANRSRKRSHTRVLAGGAPPTRPPALLTAEPRARQLECARMNASTSATETQKRRDTHIHTHGQGEMGACHHPPPRHHRQWTHPKLHKYNKGKCPNVPHSATTMRDIRNAKSPIRAR